MIIRKLQVENFRNLEEVGFEPHPRLNYLHGPNGAGKTSVLESLVVLSRGRSFRTTQAAELIGPHSNTFRVFAVAESEQGQSSRLGLERSGKRWRGRKDGNDLSQLSQLTRSLPLVLLEPDSHLLVGGSPEVRRRYLDWGMFHVEPGFLETWRNFSRALKQRNAALRTRQAAVLDSLDEILARHAEDLSRHRRRYCESIASELHATLAHLNSGLSQVEVEYLKGWSGDDYREHLLSTRVRDLERGLTMSGPHRADLALSRGASMARAVLSRGEQKMLAAALLLTQAELLLRIGESPVVLLDDLASEFDRAHFEKVLHRALAMDGQVWVTGTCQRVLSAPLSVFHVEQGRVREVL